MGHGRDLLPASEHGVPLERYIDLGTIKLRGAATAVQPVEKVAARLGDEVELQGFAAPAALDATHGFSLTLDWRALQPPTADYTVFVHVLDAANNLVAQADSPPQQGRYPTSSWDAGEQVRDVIELTLPAGLPGGDYRVQVGLYRLDTGERLPAQQSDGTAWPDNAILLKTYHVP